MNSAIERLLSLRVSDVMTTPVVTISACSSMGEAAQVFDREEISGAPVVDDAGRAIGMLSVSDFMMREKRVNDSSGEFELGCEHTLVERPANGTFQIETIREDRVHTHMSPVVQTVNETATILNAARIMCGEHIHRLVVLDETQRPVGFVSTLDLVAAMVAAVEE